METALRDFARYSLPVRLTIGSILTGDEICLAGDTDHFLATMRPSSIPSTNHARDNFSKRERSRPHICSSATYALRNARCENNMTDKSRPKRVGRHRFVRISPSFCAHWSRYGLNDATNVKNFHPTHNVAARRSL